MTQHQAAEVTSEDRELTSAIYRHFGFNGGTNLDLSNPVLQMVAEHRTRATQPLSLTIDEIRIAEREACAMVAERFDGISEMEEIEGRSSIAAAIRARS
jgi:hypothetical protein